jgi:hypothetical protein
MCLPLRRLRILDWLRKTRTVVITDGVRQTGIIDHAPVYPREVVQRARGLPYRRHPGARRFKVALLS